MHDKPLSAVLAILATLVLSGSAHAADYEVEYGAQTDSGKNAGVVRCDFYKVCGASLAALGLKAHIYLSRHQPGRAKVSLYGDDPSCCYFAAARDEVTVDSIEPVSRVPFFKGAGARGSLFIENERAGTLFLRFRFLGDKL